MYREEKLSLRRRRRRKRLSYVRVVRERPQAINCAWAVDFVHDSLLDGRRFRALTVIDEWSRECLAIEVLTGASVSRVQRLCELSHSSQVKAHFCRNAAVSSGVRSSSRSTEHRFAVTHWRSEVKSVPIC